VGMAVGGLLVLQVSLGVSNVLFSLPLAVAVAHNAGAELLLASLVWLNFKVRRR
jgi:cytochrome c oxidase assembly protein subunit 15